ncbi:unnamed protein product [Haemonchus placei]|uniref:Uncharacterized protein n=1 Tax=Haemonchus placei TaxID=6290 RepID=A0A158QQL5_HAEPC|nr:unnamed protein product [Haemonchus placei]
MNRLTSDQRPSGASGQKKQEECATTFLPGKLCTMGKLCIGLLGWEPRGARGQKKHHKGCVIAFLQEKRCTLRKIHHTILDNSKLSRAYPWILNF